MDAEERLERFAPFIMRSFPETAASGGLIESPLLEISQMKKRLMKMSKEEIKGRLLLKGDHALPIAGSIKARGGIYEVLKIAESLALSEGMISTDDDYGMLQEDRFRQFFSNYSIAVGSTGNLGLSIGIISATLGFQVTVHMSSDAKQWKKDLLKRKGVQVREYPSDYSQAVEMGRQQCGEDERCFFIDDEHSRDLFLGYAVAPMRLEKQLKEMDVRVDEDHPLFVYLPCGVGGGPGGIAYSLKMLYGEHVQCFFAEPTHSPSMLLGVMTGKHDAISVGDFGIDNRTDADGLAVGRPSSFVGKTVGPYLTGIYTVEDQMLYKLLYNLYQTEEIKLEPSALAGMYGPVQIARNGWFSANYSAEQLQNSTHIVWATGGSLVPDEIMESYLQKGNV